MLKYGQRLRNHKKIKVPILKNNEVLKGLQNLKDELVFKILKWHFYFFINTKVSGRILVSKIIVLF